MLKRSYCCGRKFTAGNVLDKYLQVKVLNQFKHFNDEHFSKKQFLKNCSGKDLYFRMFNIDHIENCLQIPTVMMRTNTYNFL